MYWRISIAILAGFFAPEADKGISPISSGVLVLDVEQQRARQENGAHRHLKQEEAKQKQYAIGSARRGTKQHGCFRECFKSYSYSCQVTKHSTYQRSCWF